MTSVRLLLTGCSLLALLVSPLSGQDDDPTWTGATVYRDGIEIHTGHGTIPAGGTDWAKVRRNSQGVKEGYGFYRSLTFPSGETIVYQFTARPLPEKEGLYEITLSPFRPSAVQAQTWGIDQNSLDAKFFQRYPSPFIVKDGEVTAIEVAENTKTGHKLVEYYLVSKGKPYKRGNLQIAAAAARDFQLEDVEIRVWEYDIRRNGVSLHRGGGCSGKYIWIEIPDVGRFSFTLVPSSVSAGFEPTALVRGQQISFQHGTDLYEWLSKEQVAPGDGLFKLWVRFDASKPAGFSHGASGRPPAD